MALNEVVTRYLLPKWFKNSGSKSEAKFPLSDFPLIKACSINLQYLFNTYLLITYFELGRHFSVLNNFPPTSTFPWAVSQGKTFRGFLFICLFVWQKKQEKQKVFLWSIRYIIQGFFFSLQFDHCSFQKKKKKTSAWVIVCFNFWASKLIWNQIYKIWQMKLENK